MTGPALFLAMLLAASGTQLTADGQILFEADQPVTFGATFGPEAIKATIVCPDTTRVRLRSERPPRRVFLDLEPLPDDAWTYDGRAGWLATSLAVGTHDLQLRFDRAASLKPFDVRIPVVHRGEGWSGPATPLTTATAHCANERLVGSFAWPGEPGLYALRAMKGKTVVGGGGVTIRLRADRAATPDRMLLETDTPIDIEGAAPAMVSPVDRIEACLVQRIAATHRVPRAELPWDSAILVEGEGFEAEGGGSVRKSTEHGNTHDGACVFAWGDPGHWIEWILPVPAADRYRLVIVTASDYPKALRSLSLDGKPPRGAPLVHFDGTGGWGRSNAEEWQPQEILTVDAAPLLLELTEGEHVLRMENVSGDHMNVDCILLVPVRGLGIRDSGFGIRD